VGGDHLQSTITTGSKMKNEEPLKSALSVIEEIKVATCSDIYSVDYAVFIFEFCYFSVECSIK